MAQRVCRPPLGTQVEALLTDRWNIFKENETLGPFMAEEVRALLREGTIDPFDMVAREGSSLRRELIEVDEIFDQKTSQFGTADRTQVGGQKRADQTPPEKSYPPSGFIPDFSAAEQIRDDGPGRRGRADPGLIIGNGPLLLARVDGVPGGYERAFLPEEARPRLRNPKSYHLVDERGRVQGPLAATDILRLYYKGVLGKGIYVVKSRSKARIPVAKFVAAMARQQSGDSGLNVLPGRGYHPGMNRGGQSLATPTVGALLSRPFGGISTNWLAFALGTLALVFGASAAWLVMSRSDVPRLKPRSGDAVNVRPNSQAGGNVRLSQADQGLESGGRKSSSEALEVSSGAVRAVTVAPPSARGKPANDGLGKKQGVLPMAARNRRGVGESNPQREKKKATSLSARDIPNALRPRDQGNQPVVAKPQTKAPAVRASAVVRQGQTPFQTASIQSPRSSIEGGRTSPRSAAIQTAPRFMPPPPPASFPRQQPALPLPPAQPGSGGATPLIDGQTVTALGPFTFDRATVAKCQAACTVVFSGPMGSVTGRFFKTVWGPILLEKNGPVRLSGLVKKSGTSIKIIVSDIQ